MNEVSTFTYLLANYVELASVILFGTIVIPKSLTFKSICLLGFFVLVLTGLSLVVWDVVTVMTFLLGTTLYFSWLDYRDDVAIKPTSFRKQLIQAHSWIRNINGLIFGFILMNLTENVIEIGLLDVLKLNRDVDQSNMIAIIIAITLPSLMILYATKIRRFNQKYPVWQTSYIQFVILMMASVLLFLLMGLFVFLELQQSFDRNVKVYIFMIVTMLIIAGVALFFFAQSYLNKLEMNHQIEQQTTLNHYVEHLEHNYHKIRRFKHDYQNMLLTLDAYIQDRDWQGLDRYYAELVQRSQDSLAIDKGQFNNLELIKCKPLKSLLYTKLVEAQEQNIEAVLEINHELREVPLVFDVSRIIGILMDNAIEEAEKYDNPKIQVGVIDDEQVLEFIIANPIDAKNFQISWLCQTNFTTKGEGHGNGLATVHKIIDRHPELALSFSIEKSNLEATVMIKRK